MKKLYIILVITVFSNYFLKAQEKMIKQEDYSFPISLINIKVINSNTLSINGKNIKIDTIKMKINNFLIEIQKELEKLTPEEKRVMGKIWRNLQKKVPKF